MKTRRFATIATLLVLAVTGLVLFISAADFIRGTALVVRAAGLQGTWPDRLTAWTAHDFAIRDMTVPSRYGPLRSRLYRPDGGTGRTVILTAGVHAEGIDEPRLVKLARDFAATGVTVLTPELPDLLEYRITPRLPDMIEDAVTWAAADRRLAADGRVGLVGISFSGGLSVVAAGRPSIAHRVAFVVSFGGHGNLGRTLRYLCTGQQPDGQYRKPHDYGVVIILLNGAERLVPPADVEPLRRAIRVFLQASHVDMVDHARARLIFQEAIDRETTLPEPARMLLHDVNTRNVDHLGPILLPHVETVTTDANLSAERSPAPTAPVFLLHGHDDNVIPSVESTLLADSLERRGVQVTLLRSSLITHAELDRAPDRASVLSLLQFWTAVLSR